MRECCEVLLSNQSFAEKKMSNEESSNNEGDFVRAADLQAMVATMMNNFQRVMQVQLGPIYDRLDRNEDEVARGHHVATPPQRRRAPIRQGEIEEEFEGDFDPEEVHNNRRNARRGGRDRVDDNLGGLKMKIPSFSGRSDPEAYIEWEKKVEFIFDCQNYSERKKVKLAVIEFTDYAVVWWDQLVTNRRRNGERPIETWDDMKAVMRKRFIPTHFYRDLHKKLHRMSQGSRSVEDYFKDMEVMMIRAGVEEDREATMARFIAGLNTEIANEVELHHYVELEDVVHKAIQVERQQKRGGRTNKFVGSSTWKPFAPKKDDKVAASSRAIDKPTTSTTATSQGKTDATPNRNRDIKCFKCQGRGHMANQCPNKRAMILRDNGEYETDDEEEDEATFIAEGEECVSENQLVLVTRRALSMQIKEDGSAQRENLFYARCQIKDKVCSLIIDGRSCTNVASTTLVEKLGLPLIKHPRPYKLQWLNDMGDVRVDHQVMVPFKIGGYEDAVRCDIIPMEVGHLLLGWPWQYDRRVIHDGYTNK